ncbi:MAG: hypothetical protein COZ05_00190 [Armatimonadetes bacterium CG_4_10_14_3_um_filter_59_10]|nr:MAG: hypothetical protein COZ05_00190 [Armatimonadetes bacterium CG_4_10_14_3_um_filter_59_10]
MGVQSPTVDGRRSPKGVDNFPLYLKDGGRGSFCGSLYFPCEPDAVFQELSAGSGKLAEAVRRSALKGESFPTRLNGVYGKVVARGPFDNQSAVFCSVTMVVGTVGFGIALMSTHTLHGWLFDCYPAPDGWVVWFVAEDGRRLRLTDAFHPSFFLQGREEQINTTLANLRRLRVPISSAPTERLDLLSGRWQSVLEVWVHTPALFPKVVEQLTRKLDWRVQVFNCDLSLEQMYFFERNLFPLAYCEFSVDGEHRLQSIRALNDPWDREYTLPDFRILSLSFEDLPINPRHTLSRRRKLELEIDGETRVIEATRNEEVIERLDQVLREYDPDIVLTQWGDSFLIPQLLRLANLVKKPIAFHRDPQTFGKPRKESSYFSYGKIIYKPGAHQFRGRWHIDSRNCFLWHECRWEGLFETARITKLPIQQLSRVSVGTGITSMQLNVAYRDKVLIPWRKREPEAFKSAAELITIDRGGLVYQPVPGFHENVAEIDFASMYPALMVSYNISPETVGCSCCPHNRLPEIGYTVCDRREGLVPKTLRPLLDKRADYRRMKKEASTPEETQKYQARQTALKWLLVVCFGYLGYKNARFGRIEAHESVTALSREILLQAKEIAEDDGYRMLHAIVDCVWVHKPGATVTDYEALSEKIAARTRIPTTLEGVYRWLHFLPSRTNPRLGVPNRYVGLYEDGSLKVRGLALRRHDTPRFIWRAQTEMLQILSHARSVKEYRELLPEAEEIVERLLQELREGGLSYEDVAITKILSRYPEQYKKAIPTAIVAGELAKRGVRLQPGETVQYVVTDAKSKDVNARARAYAEITPDWGYDVRYYEEQLRIAAREILLG